MIDIKKGTPPKGQREYLVYSSSNKIWTFCSWCTSKELWEASGTRQKGCFIDREGFCVQGITHYTEMEIPDEGCL